MFHEREVEAMGVKHVVLPGRGQLGEKRRKRQKQRWFRRDLRFRAGCEATVAHLKHGFSMLRVMYKGERGFKRYVGGSIISKNLFSIARFQEYQRVETGREGAGMSPLTGSSAQRRRLPSQIERLAEIAIFGTLSETYRTCGRARGSSGLAETAVLLAGIGGNE